RTTDSGGLVRQSALVQVDFDPAAIGRHHPVTAAVVGDCASVARAMVTMLDEAGVAPTDYASGALARRVAAGDRHRYQDRSGDGTIDIRTAMDMIDRAFPADRTLVGDTGRFMIPAFTRFTVRHPRDYVHGVNFTAIGLGMGLAVGAAIGSG